MGFNTIHRDGDCYLKGFNLTNMTSFRYKEITPYELERMSLSTTLSCTQARLTIQINGRAEIKLKDKIELANGGPYIVQSFSETHDQRPLFKRKDISRVTGGLVVALG